jgi:hypothetical protein
MLVNSVIMTLGALVWVLLCYVPLLSGGTIVFGSDPRTATAAGMGGIYYLPLLVPWPLCACLWATASMWPPVHPTGDHGSPRPER